MKLNFLLIILCVFFISLASADYCYQEQTNVSHITDGYCTLNYSGYYNENYAWESGTGYIPLASFFPNWSIDHYFSNFRDGDLDSYDDFSGVQLDSLPVGATVLSTIVYAKPIDASSPDTSIWMVKDGAGTHNLTIPSSCFIANNSYIHLTSFYYSDWPSNYMKYYCLNEANSPYPYSDITQLGSFVVSNSNFYEEAMVWDVPSYTAPIVYNINWTNLDEDMYFYDVIACDFAGNCVTSTERYYGLETLNYSFTVENLTRDISVEIGSNVTATAHSNFGNICLSSDSPELGVDFVCGLYDFTANIVVKFFRKTNNLIGSIFTANAYDDVDNVSIELSGNATNLTIYKINSTDIDKYFQGTMIGENLSTTTDYQNNINSTVAVSNNGVSTIYFLLDKSSSFISFLVNITGLPFGLDYLNYFNNASDIYTSPTEYTVAGGYLIPKKTSTSSKYLDSFEDSSINMSIWNKTADGSYYSYAGCPDCDHEYTSLTVTNSEHDGYLNMKTVSGPEDIDVRESIGKDNIVYAYLNNTNILSTSAINISLSYSGSGEEQYDTNACNYVNYVLLADEAIHTTKFDYCDEDDDSVCYEYGETIEPIKISAYKNADSSWTIVKTGIEKTTVDRWEPCSSSGCDGGTRTITYDYTSGIYSVKYQYQTSRWTDYNGYMADIGLPSTFIAYISDEQAAALQFKQYTYQTYDEEDSEGCGSVSNNLYINEINFTSSKFTNSSLQSYPIYSSKAPITVATLTADYNNTVGGYENNASVNFSMSSNGGANWDSVEPGIEHTFLNPGLSLLYKIAFNGLTGKEVIIPYVDTVEIVIPDSEPSNLTFDFGGDGIIDGNISGAINSTTNISITDSIINFNGTKFIGESYLIPLNIYSETDGIIQFNNFNLLSTIGRIFLNVTSIQNYLDNSPTGNVNVTIPMNLSSGSVNITSINYDYIGGSKEYYIKAHNDDYSINITRWIEFFYSKWKYAWGSAVDYIQFSPNSPTAKNVSVYGQTKNSPILNFTNKGYYAELEEGLVAHYKLNDQYYNNTGNVIDSTGVNNGTGYGRTFNHGTVSGGVTIEDGAMKFDGVDGKISLNSSNMNFEKNDTYTYSFWVKTNSLTKQHFIGKNYYDRIYVEGSTLVWQYYNGSVSNYAKINGISFNDYTLITAVNNGTHRLLYSNGLISSITPTTILDSIKDVGDFTFGMRGSGDIFNGSLDDVQIYSRALSQSEITAQYNLGIGHYALNNNGLVAQYSGRDYNGTSEEPQVIFDTNHLTEGKINQGIGFDGVNDYINISNSKSLNFTDTITLSAWVNLNSIQSGTTDLAVVRKNKQWALGFVPSSNKIRSIVKTDDVTGWVSTNDVYYIFEIGVWHHFLMTYNGSTVKTYVDGEQISIDKAVSGKIITGMSNLAIASESDGTSKNLDAKIDDVRIYNRSLTTDEISYIYNSGTGNEEDITLGRSNMYVYIDNTNNLTCVNMTANYTSTKSPSYIPYNTWTLFKENTVMDENIPLWMYADYNCSYSTWRYFQPTLYVRFCKDNTDVCSEDLI